ncbi:MAG: class I SAM-dependent methyltransferase [Oscillospiraceae bacterium]|nr:class I SAM-dependent methyltransferase [Oscillospiraceae bacterium]
MRAAQGWNDYELIDASSGNRLERWGGHVLVRPDPQVIWNTEKRDRRWDDADAVYHRSSNGGGSWEYRHSLPDEWQIEWNGIKLYVTPTNFKHTGVFPEQAANWAVYEELIGSSGREIKVLNLFGYTGAATLACLRAGASVCHVDASKGMVAQARRNAALNDMSGLPCRWIVDDCMKFVLREARRGSRYDAVIMDPPSYGRGPSGEVWKYEDDIFDLVTACVGILSDDPLFFALNSYTTGISPSASGYLLSEAMKTFPGDVRSDEIGLTVSRTGFVLPCGNTSLYIKR